MTARRRILVAAALLIIAFGVWWAVRPHGESGASPISGRLADQPQTQNSKLQTASGNERASERSTLADALNSSATDIRADLRLISDILATFRSNFAGRGNPVGTNAEITAALTGKNKLRLALIPPDHPAISPDGELCDRWGTPFFFHAESGTRMEIRSAGPDRKMWTDDDVVFAP